MYLKKVCYDVQERNEGEIHWDGAWVTVCCLLLPGRTAVTIYTLRRMTGMKQEMLEQFAEVFGNHEGVEVFQAPGRVNLIGGHTDYNGGHVLPCAISMGTYGAVRKRNDRKLRFYSVNFAEQGIIESDLDSLVYSKEAGWTNYPKGVIWAFDQIGLRIDCGLDLLIDGRIPENVGMASSTSLEILTCVILRDLFRFDLSNKTVAMIAKNAEKRFNGVNTGVLNQVAMAMGRKDQAIFLNARTEEYEYVPFVLENEKLVIACSNKKCGLSHPEYQKRLDESYAALIDLQKAADVHALCNLDEEQLEVFKGVIKSPVGFRRARHAVSENQRVIRACKALKEHKIEELGRLMNESHISLRDDYEVTGRELDTLVEEAWKVEGVIGSRMTSVGFGGCTVNIVKNEAVDTFMEQVGKAYKEKIGYDADFYITEVAQGPRKL